MLASILGSPPLENLPSTYGRLSGCLDIKPPGPAEAETLHLTAPKCSHEPWTKFVVYPFIGPPKTLCSTYRSPLNPKPLNLVRSSHVMHSRDLSLCPCQRRQHSKCQFICTTMPADDFAVWSLGLNLGCLAL